MSLIVNKLKNWDDRQGVKPTNGFIPILPNKNHRYFQLSPMILGPVYTGETEFPISWNLENYWQGSKLFAQDLEPDGRIGLKYKESKRKMYLDKTPHRHKYKRGMRPYCTIFYNGTIGEHYDYIGSRKFYCNHYTFLAKQQKQYQTILEMLKSGKNLEILGYDGSYLDSRSRSLEDDIKFHYNDDKEPFGHEKVLFTILCKDLQLIDSYPWSDLEIESFYPNKI